MKKKKNIKKKKKVINSICNFRRTSGYYSAVNEMVRFN